MGIFRYSQCSFKEKIKDYQCNCSPVAVTFTVHLFFNGFLKNRKLDTYFCNSFSIIHKSDKKRQMIRKQNSIIVKNKLSMQKTDEICYALIGINEDEVIRDKIHIYAQLFFQMKYQEWQHISKIRKTLNVKFQH